MPLGLILQAPMFPLHKIYLYASFYLVLNSNCGRQNLEWLEHQILYIRSISGHDQTAGSNMYRLPSTQKYRYTSLKRNLSITEACLHRKNLCSPKELESRVSRIQITVRKKHARNGKKVWYFVFLLQAGFAVCRS